MPHASMRISFTNTLLSKRHQQGNNGISVDIDHIANSIDTVPYASSNKILDNLGRVNLLSLELHF